MLWRTDEQPLLVVVRTMIRMLAYSKILKRKGCSFMSKFPIPVKIDTVSGGIVQFGNSLFISPKNATKSAHGSGSSNTGVHITTFNGSSATTTVNSDLFDQPIVHDN